MANVSTDSLTDEDLEWIDEQLELAGDPRPEIDVSWVTFDELK